MPWELRQVILGIHIFLAIIWAGGILFIGWGVYPAVRNMPYAKQREFFLALIQWSHNLLTAAGTGVIATGIVLGTLAGPINQWSDIWSTRYGNLWFAALAVALCTLGWGIFIGYRQSVRVFSDLSIWELADSGDKKPLTAALRKTIAIESVEVTGFVALLIIMILL